MWFLFLLFTIVESAWMANETHEFTWEVNRYRVTDTRNGEYKFISLLDFISLAKLNIKQEPPTLFNNVDRRPILLPVGESWWNGDAYSPSHTPSLRKYRNNWPTSHPSECEVPVDVNSVSQEFLEDKYKDLLTPIFCPIPTHSWGSSSQVWTWNGIHHVSTRGTFATWDSNTITGDIALIWTCDKKGCVTHPTNTCECPAPIPPKPPPKPKSKYKMPKCECGDWDEYCHFGPWSCKNKLYT